MTGHKEENKNRKEQHKYTAVKPEPETLHTPDPQDKMEEPISSLVRVLKDGLNDDETQKEADKEKDRKISNGFLF